MEDNLFKSDIFFVTTTIAVVLCSVVLFIIFLYCLKIVKNINIVSKKIKEESIGFLEDAKAFRSDLKEQGGSFVGLIKLLFNKKNKRYGNKKK